MPEPMISARHPEVLTLAPGTYSWCVCGHSKKGALCDGSHMGRGFCPQTFVIEEERKVALCQCRHTKNPPYCDGTHKTLPEA